MTVPDPAQPTSPPGALLSVDPKEVLHGIIRRKWLSLAAILILGTIAGTRTAQLPKVYEGRARILLEPEATKVLGERIKGDIQPQASQSATVFSNTQYRILKSRAILEATAHALKLGQNEAFISAHDLTNAQDRERAAARVLSEIVRVEPDKATRIVDIVVEDYDFKRAARIANTLGQIYMDNMLHQRTRTTRSASRWLEARVQEFEAKIQATEERLNDFMVHHQLLSISLQDRQGMTAIALSRFTEDLIAIKSQIIGLESEQKALRPVMEDEKRWLTLPRISRNAVVSELLRQISALEQKRTELEVDYGPRHPKMQVVAHQTDEARSKIRTQIDLAAGSLEAELEVARLRESELVAAIADQKSEAMAMNELALDYGRLSRELESTRETHKDLIKRRTETDLAALLETNHARWLEQAEPAAKVIRPSVAKATALGMLAGLLLGLTIAIMSALLDNAVRTQDDVEVFSGLPFMGVLPRISEPDAPKSKKEMSNRDLYIATNPKSAVAECARSLRTNLLFLGTDQPLRRIMLTSAGAGEGKSTVTIAVGIAMAQAGQRVLLVDTDFRRPRLHRTLGAGSDLGFTSILVDNKEPEDVIQKTDVEGMHLLPCGPLPPNPAELLHTDRFLEVLEALEQRYDCVLFDSPPLNIVTDAAILSRMVDGTILVVKTGKTSKDALRRCRQLLDSVQARVLGAVLNDFDRSTTGYYYYRGGYTYYHYNYQPYHSDGLDNAKA